MIFSNSKQTCWKNIEVFVSRPKRVFHELWLDVKIGYSQSLVITRRVNFLHGVICAINNLHKVARMNQSLSLMCMSVCASSQTVTPDIRVSHSQIERFITRNAAASVCINGNGLCRESEDATTKNLHFPALKYLLGARVIYAAQKLNEPSDSAAQSKHTHLTRLTSSLIRVCWIMNYAPRTEHVHCVLHARTQKSGAER